MDATFQSKSPFDAAMASTPVIAIVRLPEASAAVAVAAAVHRGGIRLIEITLTTARALDALGAMRDADLDGLSVGVGSVRTADGARRSIDSGAEYVVTPTTNIDVLRTCREARVPVVCGGLTPTELDTAHHAGAAYVKLFPASAVGPQYLRDVLAPMPDLRIVPTGGISAETIPLFKVAGAVGVGVGSTLVDQETVVTGSWAELERRAKALVYAWQQS